mgnify:CR=1 FL=1
MKILKRNVSKDELKEFLNNIDLEDKNLYEELGKNQNWIFQFSGNTGSRMTAELKPDNFDDVINLNAMSRPGSSYNFGNYCLIKNENQKSPYPEQIQKFLSKSRGLINFQEEIMQITEYISNGRISGNACRGLLKKLGKANPKQADKDKWKEYVVIMKEEGVKKDIQQKDIELLCSDMETLSKYTFNFSHAAAYSYLAMETVYLAKYFKPYFYAVNLANEAGKKDAIKDAIRSCKNSGFEIMPPDINNSKQHFFPKDGKLYFGLEDIKGVGEEPAKIIVENQSYTSIIDFIIKTLNTKINKRVTLALIGSGAFDSIFGSENRKYYFDVTQLFYERKKTKKTPEILIELWEECEKEIENKKDKSFLMESEVTYLGDAFFNNRFSVINDKIEMLYKRGLCLRDFNEIREKNLPKQLCFVWLSKWRVIQDKKGRDMSFATIEDRNGEEVSVPFFFNLYPYVKKQYFGDGFYLLDVWADENGKIMPGSRNWLKKESELNNIMRKVPGV